MFWVILFLALLFLWLVWMICLILDVNFGIKDSYVRGERASYQKNYKVQDNAWYQFWYDRGFARETRFNSDAEQKKRDEREKAKSDRVLARAKSKGWLDES